MTGGIVSRKKEMVSLFDTHRRVCSFPGFLSSMFKFVHAGTVLGRIVSNGIIWVITGSPHRVGDYVSVNTIAGPTTMEGVQTLFNPNYIPKVFGHLIGAGDERNRTIFTLKKPTPRPSEQSHVIIRERANFLASSEEKMEALERT